MGERTNIYNLTDVTPRPVPLKIFRQFIAPGGKMIVPVSKLRTRSVQKRLAVMAQSRTIFVGAAPPAWYVAAKVAAKKERRQAQAYKAPVAELVEEPAKGKGKAKGKAKGHSVVRRKDLMKALRKLTKKDLAAFAVTMESQPPVSVDQTKADMLLTVEQGLADDVVLLPGMTEFLEG